MRKQHNSQHQQIISQITNSCETKNAKRGLKALAKTADLSYLYGGASMVAEVLRTVAPDNDTPVHVVIHSALDKDVFDHCRWYALVPLLLNQVNRKFTFTILVDEKVTDTPTRFRRVIDYIIAAELKGNVDVQLMESNLHDYIEQASFDGITCVINNVLSKHDVSSNDIVSTLRELVSKGIPYVISDVAPVPLLYKMSFLTAIGLSSRTSMIKNQFPIRFNKIQSVSYSHFGYAAVLTDVDSEYRFDRSILAGLFTLEYQLLDRFEHHDPLDMLPVSDQGNLRLFKDVSYDAEKNTFTIAYHGDVYHLAATDICSELPFPLDNHGLSDQSANVCTALHIYAQLVNHIKMRRAA